MECNEIRWKIMDTMNNDEKPFKFMTHDSFHYMSVDRCVDLTLTIYTLRCHEKSHRSCLSSVSHEVGWLVAQAGRANC